MTSCILQLGQRERERERERERAAWHCTCESSPQAFPPTHPSHKHFICPHVALGRHRASRLPVRPPACLPACLAAWLPGLRDPGPGIERPLPAYLLACLPACLRACVFTCVPVRLLALLPDCLPACLPGCLSASVPSKGPRKGWDPMEVPKCEVHKQLFIGSHNPEIRRQEEFRGCGMSCCQNAGLKQISCSSVRMFQECGMSCCQNDSLSPIPGSSARMLQGCGVSSM